MSDGQPQVFDRGRIPESTAYRLSPPRASAHRQPRRRLAQRLSLRHGLDQGDRPRRRGRAARPRPPAVRLFRPWPLRGAARGRDDLALARGSSGAGAGRDRGAADCRRLVDGRLSRAPRRPRARRGGRDGAHQGPDSHRARRRLHRSADLGQGAGRSPARDHGERRMAAAVRLFERARLLHPRAHRGRAQASSARRHDSHPRADRGAARHAGRGRALIRTRSR